MSIALKLRYRRDKVFGEGKCLPLDRNAKVRIMVLARALKRRTAPRKHYGQLTDKFVAVLEALLFGFHNAASGRCFPSYEAIADKAGCVRSTVYEAINALERAGILSWVNRITRVREWGPDLFGRARNRVRVIRTSNAYTFNDPKESHAATVSSKSELPTGTTVQDLLLPVPRVAGPLQEALNRLGKAIEGERRVACGAAKGFAK